MIIIGEKINGTRKAVAAAIQSRDGAFIEQLALAQADADSHYLDINAGTPPDREADDLAWLVGTIQAVVDIPLCIDSANPEALKAGLALVNKTPIINSVSGERQRIENVLPLALEHKTNLILLALDDKAGIPETCQGRMDIIHHLVGLAKSGGLEENQLYIDPLVTAISTGDTNALITYDTIRHITDAFPQSHITCGLSNISFGLPMRSLINRTFLSMSVLAGLDSAIIDPNDRELMSTMLAAEMLAGKDKYCQQFNRAYRAGLIQDRRENS